MPDWKNIKLIYGDNTLDHISRHRVSLSEVHNALDGFFIPYRINVNGILRYLILGESYGRVLVVILEPSGTREMRLITAFDAPDSKKKLYRGKLKSE
ncbi:Uncharacterised protein [uncultured archaeon]|nr:Uncharacterised protein [uncultured archaeon]